MSQQSPSRRPLLLALAAGVGIILVVLAVLYWGREEPLPPHEGLDGPKLEAPAAPDDSRAPTTEHKTRNRTRASDKTKKAKPAERPRQDAAVTKTDRDLPPVKEAFEAESKGQLEVVIIDGLEGLPEADRPHYGLLLRPVAGIDPWLNARIEKIHSGNNRIEGLAGVDWTAELVGDSLQRREFKIPPEGKETIRWDDASYLHGFAPLRIEGVDAEGSPVKDLRLFCRQAGGPPLQVAEFSTGVGLVDLLIGPDLSVLHAASSGYLRGALNASPKPELDLNMIFRDPTSEAPLDARIRGNYRVEFSERSFQLEGKVENEKGEGQPGARVVYLEGAGAEAALDRLQGSTGIDGDGRASPTWVRTDTRGRFSLDLPPNMSGIVVAIAAGFAVSRPESVVTGQPEDKAEIDLVMPAGRKIRGRGPVPEEAANLRSACYGPLDDILTRIKPARDGSYLIQTAPRERFAIGLFDRSSSTTAAMTWPVEMDQVATKALLTR